MKLSAYKQGAPAPFIEKVIEAKSIKDRMIGLLSYASLDTDSALWIKPCNYIHTFFMRFSIDVLFLNAQHEVLAVHVSLKPFRFSRRISNAVSVLEMPEGSIQMHTIRIGDQINFLEKHS